MRIEYNRYNNIVVVINESAVCALRDKTEEKRGTMGVSEIKNYSTESFEIFLMPSAAVKRKKTLKTTEESKMLSVE